MKDRFCVDFDGNEVREGDTVEYWSFIKCRGEKKIGKVKCIMDMNSQQTDMPFIEGECAWHPQAIRKVF